MLYRGARTPLYYVDGANRFAFSSELKALFQDTRVARRPDVDALRRFLLFRLHDDGEDTFFDGVKRLLPAHTMLVRPDGIVKPGIVEGERGKPREILGESEIVAVEGALRPKERQSPDQLLARDEREKKGGLWIHRLHRLQVGGIGAHFEETGCSVGL